MKIIAQISTHKAVKENGKITIYEKGFKKGKDVELNEMIDKYGWDKDRKLYSIPLENEDDVFSIMENYEETNRCNLAELNGN